MLHDILVFKIRVLPYFDLFTSHKQDEIEKTLKKVKKFYNVTLNPKTLIQGFTLTYFKDGRHIEKNYCNLKDTDGIFLIREKNKGKFYL